MIGRYGIKGRSIVDLKTGKQYPIVAWKTTEYAASVLYVRERPHNDGKIYYRYGWFCKFPTWGMGVQ